jgi:hypothetical protein
LSILDHQKVFLGRKFCPFFVTLSFAKLYTLSTRIKIGKYGPLKMKIMKLKMGCPALGIWVAFLKQPDALPGRVPQKNKNNIFLNYF